MKQVIWVIVVLLVIWGVYALATNKSTPADTEMPPASNEKPATVAPANSLDVADQKPGKSVTILSYTLAVPGYIALHAATAIDTAGDLLGSTALLQPGTGSNVEVVLPTATKDGQKLAFLLYTDDGDGKLDVKTDLPATAKDVAGAEAVLMKIVSVKK